MKKSFTIILLFIFLFNQVGFFIAFKMAKENNYTSVRKHIQSENLAVLSIPKKDAADIQFVNEDECIYKGKRYDVFHKAEKNGNVLLYCFADDKEDTLYKGLNDAVAQQVASDKPQQKNNSKSTLQFQLNEYLQPQNNFSFQNELTKYIALTSSEDFISWNPQTDSPPPEMFFG